MDHRQFVRAIEIMRSVAARTGPQHAFWDVIFDAEALLEGRETLLPKHEVVAAVEREFEKVK
jgi:hypothetical protein